MLASPRFKNLHTPCSQLVRHFKVARFPYHSQPWRSPSNDCQNTISLSSAHYSTSLSSSSSSHNSLSSFLSYARATHLSRSSTVYTGTRYEYIAQDALRTLGFTLTRSGGRADGGIDLYGTWHLPDTSLKCIVQCKALAKKVGPNLVRELEGALATSNREAVGVLCATREASKGVREAVRKSRRGIIWVMLEEEDVEEHERGGDEKEVDEVKAAANGTGAGTGRVRQVLWNERVAEMGAIGVTVGVVYGQPHSDGEGDGEVPQEVRLMWKGELWEPKLETEESDPS